jgi:hypothetical protein
VPHWRVSWFPSRRSRDVSEGRGRYGSWERINRSRKVDSVLGVMYRTIDEPRVEDVRDTVVEPEVRRAEIDSEGGREAPSYGDSYLVGWGGAVWFAVVLEMETVDDDDEPSQAPRGGVSARC